MGRRWDKGEHGLWLDLHGNLYDRAYPPNVGRKLRDFARPVPPWFGQGAHPAFRVQRPIRYVSFHRAPVELSPDGADVGDCLVVWYTHRKLLSAPVWLLLREDRNPDSPAGSFLVSTWTEDDCKGVSPPPPAETRIGGGSLDKIESVFSAGAQFSGLSEDFRRAWAAAWGTPVQKPARREAESAKLGDVLEAVAKGSGDLVVTGAKQAVTLAADVSAPVVQRIALPIAGVVALAALWWFTRRR